MNAVNLPQILPLMPLRGIVVFPYMICPLIVGRESSKLAIEHAIQNGNYIYLTCTKNEEIETPSVSDLYKIGTVAEIIKFRRNEDGTYKVLYRGVRRARIVSTVNSEPHLTVEVELLEEETNKNLEEITTEIKRFKLTLKRFLDAIKILNPNFFKGRHPDSGEIDVYQEISLIDDPGKLADTIFNWKGLPPPEAQQFLEMIDPVLRLSALENLIKHDADRAEEDLRRSS